MIKSFEEQISRFKTEINDKQLEYNTLEGAFNSQKEYLRSKQEEIDEIKKAHLRLSEEFLQLKSSFDLEIKSKKTMETRMADVEKENYEVVEKLRSRNLRLKDKIRSIKDQIEDPGSGNRSKIEDLEARLAQAELVIKERAEL